MTERALSVTACHQPLFRSLWGGCSSAPLYDSYRQVRDIGQNSVLRSTVDSRAYSPQLSDLKGSKVLAKRHLEGLFARGFRAAHGLLPSSLRATSEQLTSYFRAAYELLRSSSRATSKQFTSYFATTHELLRSSLRVTSKQLTSHFRASPSLDPRQASIPGKLLSRAGFDAWQASIPAAPERDGSMTTPKPLPRQQTRGRKRASLFNSFRARRLFCKHFRV